MLTGRAAELCTLLTPFVLAAPSTQKILERRPLGVPLAADHLFDPLHSRSAPLIERLHALDEASFGPGGMPMPHWIMLDGSALPGVVFGLGRPASDLSEEARVLLRVPPDYADLVPLSMYIAIPSFESATWVGHNLASVGRRLPDLPHGGLGSVTKALALALLRARVQIGVAQWDNPALHVHTRLGALELLTAWTPAHSKPWTLTYRVKVDDYALRHLAREPGVEFAYPEPSAYVDLTDHAAMQALQRRIEAGERWVIAGPPERNGAAHRVPIAPAPA